MQNIAENDLAAEVASGNQVRLVDLARRFGVSASTCFRWVVKGLPTGSGTRVKLEAIKRGNTWLTSEAALKRFFGALPKSAPPPSTAPIRSPSKRQRDCERAKHTLKETYGI